MRKMHFLKPLVGVTLLIVVFALTSIDIPMASSEDQNSSTDPEQCLLCHTSPESKIKVDDVEFKHSPYIEKKINCYFCHLGIVQGEGKVLSDNCYSCHASEKILQKTSETEFLHQLHAVQHKINCTRCHEKITHPAGEKIIHWRELGAKNTNHTSCSTCHGKQHLSSLLIYTGRAREDAKKNPSVMAKVNLTCQGCHREREAKYINKGRVQIARAKPDACDTCHGRGFGKALIPMWQKPVKEKYKKLINRIKRVQRKISKKGEAYKLLKKAEDILELIQTDGSWGAHNPNYVNLLLNKAESYLNKAENL